MLGIGIGTNFQAFGAGGATGVYLDADFLNETYQLNGAAVTLADLFAQDATWGTFTGVVDANGLTMSATELPAVKSTVADIITDSSFTVVATVKLTGSDPGFFLWQFENTLTDSWRADVYLADDSYTASADNTVASDTATYDMVANQLVTIVARFTPTTVSLTVNGQTIQTVTPSNFAVSKPKIGMYGDCYLETFKIYRRAFSDAEMLFISDPGEGVTLDAPTLVWVSGTSDNTPAFTGYTPELEVGDWMHIEIDDNSSFTSPTTYSNQIDSGEKAIFTAGFTSGALADGTYYARSRLQRGSTYSDWSNTETKAIAALTPTTVFGPKTLNLNDLGDHNISFRVRVPAISTGGTEVRVRIRAPSATCTIDNISIGKATGTDSETTAVPTELLQGGVSGISVAAGTDEWTDWTTFATANGDALVVIMDADATEGNFAWNNSTSAGTNTYYRGNFDSYNLAAPTGFALLGSADRTFGVMEIQVR